MDKYYVPKIEEFCVGFEYELLETYDKEKLWSTIFIDHADVFDITQIEENLGDILPNSYNENDNWEESKIRVKYLDASDIKEVLGVEPNKKGTEWYCKLNFDDKFYTISYCKEHKELMISVFYKGFGTISKFKGTIKNKSEFKKILEWTGVAKELQRQRIIDLMKEDERNGRYKD